MSNLSQTTWFAMIPVTVIIWLSLGFILDVAGYGKYKTLKALQVLMDNDRAWWIFTMTFCFGSLGTLVSSLGFLFPVSAILALATLVMIAFVYWLVDYFGPTAREKRQVRNLSH